MDDDITDRTIAIDGYTIVRRDRRNNGGGIMGYVNDTYDFDILPFNNPNNYEILPLFFKQSKNLFIIVYHPYWTDNTAHTNTLEIFDNIIKSVQENFTNIRIHILGDFNGLIHKMDQFCTLYKAKNIVNFHTRGNAIIDCVYTQAYRTYICHQLSPVASSDHCVIKCVPSGNTNRNNIVYKEIPDYSPENRRLFHDTISNTDFSLGQSIDSVIDLDFLCEQFILKLYSILCHCFPTKKVKSRINNVPWVTDSIRLVMSKRDKAFKDKNRSLFIHYRNKVKHMIKDSRYNYVTKIGKLQDNQSWNSFKTAANLAKNKSINHGIFTTTDFLNFFTDAPNNIDTLLNVIVPSNDFCHVTISEEEINRAINNLNKGGGIPFLPPWIFKLYRERLMSPLRMIFEASMSMAYVPKSLKIASITPVPKVSKPNSVQDFRPITTTSPILKLLEHIVLQKWLTPLITEHQFSDQYAFVPLKGRGCTSALTCIISHCLRTLEQNNFINMLLVDFSKAFDRVSPISIVNALILSGASTQTAFWVYNFMISRQVCVKLNNSISNFKIIDYGTPQGSKISPILFAFLCSSLKPTTSSCTFYKYADDLTILHTGTTKNDNNHLSKEVQHLSTWCKNNGMLINASKTKLMHINRKKNKWPPSININNTTIECINHCRLLGIFIQNDLKWDLHISYVTSKTNKLFFPLVCLKRSKCHRDLLLQYYLTFVRPILTYAFPAFCNLNQQQNIKLQKVEKRLTNFIGFKPKSSLNEFFHHLCLNLKKSIVSYSDHPFRKNLIVNDNNRTRSASNLTIMPGHTTQYVSSFIRYFI